MLEGEKVAKTENLRKCFVWYFGVWRKREKSVCTLFTTVCNFTSHTHLTNHHTEVIQSYHFQTIIPSSYQNHTILETYVNVYIYRNRCFCFQHLFSVSRLFLFSSSFPSILLLSFVYCNENNNSARRRPFKAKKGKVRLLISFCFVLFFLKEPFFSN